ncbi:hypothetical protein [Aneurinibacillus tyrosinisolvens]|uniref:hypothetical protein n=1 Tax=Aneurinibacillus tyrosinisolvens TaxID=1443435 RepID=UPI00063F1CB5|nr:hypothetical protein [Aneurinibacillus tyrosinisolvens]
MKYNELELRRLMKKDYNSLIAEEVIQINLLNFIRCIHLNKQDFYAATFNTTYSGDIEMSFIKAENCLIGYCKVSIKKKRKMIHYLFTQDGYEEVAAVLK